MLRKVRNYPTYRIPNELREVGHTKTVYYERYEIIPIGISNFIHQYIGLQMESNGVYILEGHYQIGQMESMFMGHFQIALNPY